MTYEERLKRIIENDDPFWFVTLNKFIEETYENKEVGIDKLEKLAKDKERFNEFTKQVIQKKDNLKSVKDEFLTFNEDNNKIEFSQKELKNLFYYTMNENELEKINELNLKDIISKIQSPKFQVKYIDNIGYVLIGEGYLILKDKTRPTHYFVQIFTDNKSATDEIMNIYNKRFPNDK